MKYFYILFVTLNLTAQNLTTIPDSNFEQALVDLQLDDMVNGAVATDSISVISFLDISSKNISDLTGISAFAALDTLVVSNNQLTTIDVSTHINLKYLDASDNALSDFSLNPLIEEIYFQNNNLEEADLSLFGNLKAIRLEDNDLIFLDISNGNNENLIKTMFTTQHVDFRNNPRLECVKVDNVNYMYVERDYAIDLTNTFYTEETCPVFCDTPTSAPQDFLVGTYIIETVQNPTLQFDNGGVYEQEVFPPLQLREVYLGETTSDRYFPATVFPNLIGFNLIVNDTIDFNLKCDKIQLSEVIPDLIAGITYQNDHSILDEILLVTPTNDRVSVPSYTSDDVTMSYKLIPAETSEHILTDIGIIKLLKIEDFYNVNDTNFEQKLVNLGHDDIVDGKIWAQHIYDVEALDLSNENISDLTGIEGFRVLKSLDVSDNSISSLDLSKNLQLEDLNAAHNNLTEIDLSGHLSIKKIVVNDNNLSSLNLNNGHNSNLLANPNNPDAFNFDARNNANLSCIEVSDENHMITHFSNFIDTQTNFSENPCETLSTIEQDLSFSIYPNPASDYIVIENNNIAIVKIEILDATGKIITSYLPENENEHQQLSISSIQSGLYFMRIKAGDDSIFVKKIIVKD
jgi:hypothetical protein